MKSKRFSGWLKVLGPGMAVAATGVGAGDLIAASVAGARYGTAILWAALFGAIVKFSLNEGIGRWQLATGTTLVEGWSQHLGRWVSVLFAGYLALWSFIVAGALISACGLAAHALVPAVSVEMWGILHSLLAVVLVSAGRYALFEKTMKLLIGLMFVVLMACAALVLPDASALPRADLLPAVPPGSGAFLLGVIGGVGGSVTLLNYGYWIREKQWTERSHHPRVQLDLGAAYLLTGLFGAAVMIISAGVNPAAITGSRMVLEVGDRLQAIIGSAGRWAFLLGFWGAVFSSMLGVWQGVPYIFADFIRCWKTRTWQKPPAEMDARSPAYRLYLLYLALPPMLLLLFQRPVWIVVIYSVAGAFFMPFLATTLLYLNNRWELVGALKNRWQANLLLLAAIGVFGYLCAHTLAGLL